MKRTVALLGLMAVACLSTGCMGRLFNEAAGATLGAKANVIEGHGLELDRSRPLGPVTIGQITNSVGRPATDDWLTALAFELGDRLAKDLELNGPGRAGSRPVKLTGEVIHVEGASMTDQAFGPHPEVIVRVTVTDAATGRVLGVANILGRGRGGTAGSGQDSLCKAFAEGVNKWLRSADKPR